MARSGHVDGAPGRGEPGRGRPSHAAIRSAGYISPPVAAAWSFWKEPSGFMMNATSPSLPGWRSPTRPSAGRMLSARTATQERSTSGGWGYTRDAALGARGYNRDGGPSARGAAAWTTDGSPAMKGRTDRKRIEGPACGSRYA